MLVLGPLGVLQQNTRNEVFINNKNFLFTVPEIKVNSMSGEGLLL
jgi:hypothetical protein